MPMSTASIWSAILSNIFLKSWKRGSAGKVLSASSVCGAPMSVSHSATTSQTSVFFESAFRSNQACAPHPIAARRTFPLTAYAFGEKHPGISGYAPAARIVDMKLRRFIFIVLFSLAYAICCFPVLYHKSAADFTGPKLIRCSGHGPSRASAARCAAVG